MNRILLIGANGQIGCELQRALKPLGEVTVLGHREMDLADPDAILHVMREQRPDVVVNAAAYTAVDRAEKEPDIAMAVNGTAPGILAEEAKRYGTLLVHYSTDYVFDGEKSDPYTEEDAPSPINTYGQTKLAGEQAIQAAGAPYLILRTSWIFGARGSNFMLTILRLARQQPELKIVSDQIGAPTWSRMVADATAQILARIYATGGWHASRMIDTGGIYHLTASGQTSWFGFADAIVREAARLLPSGSARGLYVTQVRPITTEEYPLPAKRPRNSLMSNRKLETAFGLALPSWEWMLSMCLQEMSGNHLSDV